MNKMYSLFIVFFVSLMTINTAVAQAIQGPTFEMTTTNTNITAGQMVAVQVKVKNFKEIMSSQYSIHWNPLKLEYASISELGLPALSLTDFGYQGTQNGTLVTAWFDPTIKGVTLADDKVIYTINFKALSSGSIDLYFAGYPVEKEITSGINFNEVTSSTQFLGLHTPGSVTASTAFVKGPTFELLTVYNNTQPNDIIAVKVNVRDFNKILNFQYSVNWDPQQLQFLNHGTTYNLPGFAASNFGLTEANQGMISVAWFDNTISGVNLPDNTTTFTLYFKALVHGCSPVHFTDNPAIKEVYNITNIYEITKTSTFIDLQKIVLAQHDAVNADILKVNTVAPNPFSDQSNLTFTLGASGDVSFEIFDLLGQKVSNQSAFYNAGTHNINLDTDLMAVSGTYIYKIKTNTTQQSGQLIKLK
jgi:hypothetical protein